MSRRARPPLRRHRRRVLTRTLGRVVEPWWKSAVVYQIYPRSFADTNGDGVGDLNGITEHLDHIERLGVDAMWISPFFTSPMKDYGYDVADYTGVDPLFGTLEDFDRLIDEAHRRHLRVLIDWVPNHTSDQHPWFQESRQSRTNDKADWYVWKDADPTDPAKPPTNWRCAFTDGPAWEWVEERQQWYLHLFLPEQPDLNWRNPQVRGAMHDTLRFWLDRGVDGFRIDVVHGLMKDPSWPDLPDEPENRRRYGPMIYDVDATIDLVRDFRHVLEEYAGDRVMVGEVYILSTAQVARYYGDGDALHMAFNFPPLYAPWEAAAWRKRVDRVVDEFDPRNAWPTWVLSNHDNPRHRTRYGGREDRARAAALLLLTLRGTPFVYAGEELGLEDAIVPAHRVLDPGGRDGCRAPIPWTPRADHGWGQPDNWLPWPPNAETANAATQASDASSMLALYRRILAARQASPALQLGDWRAIDAPAGVLAYERHHAPTGDRRVVLVNFSDDMVRLPLDVAGAYVVEVATDDRTSGSYDGTVQPSQALMLRPAPATVA